MSRRRILFVYLGRRGALARFTLDLAKALQDHPEIEAQFLVSSDMEQAVALDELGQRVRRVRTFSSSPGAALLWRVGGVRTALRKAIAEFKPDALVELMPHVWSPFLQDVARDAGVLRASIVHDWGGHPGDLSGIVNGWIGGAALKSDVVLTLSQFVRDEILRAWPDLKDKLHALFHPDFAYAAAPLAPSTDKPLTILSFGRLHAYKGLDLLVGAAERLRARNIPVRLSIKGAGDLAALGPRLAALGADVENRWLADTEIEAALRDCDVVAATYTEASQSGVAAAAFGAGRPVVATPVGALPEQVTHGVTGLIAERADAESVADAIAKLANDRALLAEMAANIREQAPRRSMRAFAEALSAALWPQRL